MNRLALQRLTSAGWTPDRKADYSSIEREYADAGMLIPEKLKTFFSSFALLDIEFEPDITQKRNSAHRLYERLCGERNKVEVLFDPLICFDSDCRKDNGYQNDRLYGSDESMFL